MKIAVIGCGKIARAHAEVLESRIDDSTLVFCDRNLHKAAALAAEFSGRTPYDDANQLLAEERPDSVHVLTQLPSHATLAGAALAAGAHVYIEKPITETAAEFTELLSLAESNLKLLCAGYSTLGIPVVQQAKALIASERFGRLITVHCDFNWTASGESIPYGSSHHWAYSMKGGILQNLIDHPMSLVVDALGEVEHHKALFVRRNELPANSPDLVQVGLSTRDQIGSLSVSFGHGNTYAAAHYFLEAGTVVVDLRRQLLSYLEGRGPDKFSRKLLSGMRLGWDFGRGSLRNAVKRVGRSWQRHPGIAGLIENFYGAIAGTQDLVVSASTATRTVAILERVWEDRDASLG